MLWLWAVKEHHHIIDNVVMNCRFGRVVQHLLLSHGFSWSPTHTKQVWRVHQTLITKINQWQKNRSNEYDRKLETYTLKIFRESAMYHRGKDTYSLTVEPNAIQTASAAGKYEESVSDKGKAIQLLSDGFMANGFPARRADVTSFNFLKTAFYFFFLFFYISS